MQTIKHQMLQDKFNEMQTKMNLIEKQWNDDTEHYKQKDKKQKAFIDELQRMNELQNKENSMLQNRR